MKQIDTNNDNLACEQIMSDDSHEDVCNIDVHSSNDFKSQANISDNVIAAIVHKTVKDVQNVHTLQDSISNMIIKEKNALGVKIVHLNDKKTSEHFENRRLIYLLI